MCKRTGYRGEDESCPHTALMTAERKIAHFLMPLILALVIQLWLPLISMAADEPVAYIPPASCSAEWEINGKPILYNVDTLSDRINGEAELYFPYGFDQMAAARYAPKNSPGIGMDLEIYRMGSLLDAFGIYASYRGNNGRNVNIGSDSSLSGSQLFFYQGRYFIHIQVTGTDSVDPAVLVGCAKKVASALPGDSSPPRELSAFDRPEMVKGTLRYLPQSLLGYDFLNRGIITDAMIDGTTFQLFLLLSGNAEAATSVFERFRSQLTRGKVETGASKALFLEGVDSLYGPIIVLKTGKCLAGALRFSGIKGVRPLLESVCR